MDLIHQLNPGLPSLGLYRHFKGSHYYLHNILRDAENACQTYRLEYFNVFYPECGYFTCSVDHWNADVSDRADNVTGNTYRFERVVSIDNGIKNFTTEALLKELSVRKDSPLQDVDYPGLSKAVFATDYCVGERQFANADHPNGVFTEVAFDSKEDAHNYLIHTAHCRNSDVFKRVFIPVD